MPRVVHFEINADNPERAAEFYSKVFGWKISKWDGPMPYWLVTTGEKGQPGIDGGIQKRTEPKGTTYNTVDVPDVDEFVNKIKRAGGKVLKPKNTIPGVGFFAYCEDTEGNIFGVLQPDMNAK
jgi:predicted enzyme related to lactoylglutathione lyase